MFINPEPDRSQDGFWAVPGVEPQANNSREGFKPGTVGVAGFQPISTPAVDQISEQVAGLDNVDEALAVAQAALVRISELTGPPVGGKTADGQSSGQATVGGVGGGSAAGVGRSAGVGGGAGMLDQLTGLLKAGNSVDGLISRLVAGVDKQGVCPLVTGADLTSWLMLKANLTRRQAAKLVIGSRHSVRFGLVDEAAVAGAVNSFQVAAISDVLRFLPEDLDEAEVDEAEQVLVGLADRCGSDMLGRLTEEVLERVAPAVAQQVGEDKAKRQLERAERERFVSSRDNGDGTIALRGLLPTLDGELVRVVLDQAAEQLIKDQADAPDGCRLDRGQARADSLVDICRHVQQCASNITATNSNRPDGSKHRNGSTRAVVSKRVPGSGATLLVRVGLADLLGADDGNSPARIAGSGYRLDAETVNVLACDTDVVRVLVGAKGELLDIGRKTRAIPPGLRRALIARDGGCCFPGCDRPPDVCQAHHVKPWQQGGATALDNLCSLCPSHHRLVEPPRVGDPPWKLTLNDNSHWQFTPPPWLDPNQQPIVNHRH